MRSTGRRYRGSGIVLAQKQVCTSAKAEATMSAGSAYAPTSRTTPTRYRERARYDRATVHGILDEALICHVGFVGTDGPVVLPTTHARLSETLYLHGATGRGLTLAAAGAAGLPPS